MGTLSGGMSRTKVVLINGNRMRASLASCVQSVGTCVQKGGPNVLWHVSAKNFHTS